MKFNSNNDVLTIVRNHGLLVLDDCGFENKNDFLNYLESLGNVLSFAYTSTDKEAVSIIDNHGKLMPQAGALWNEKPAGDWHIDTVFTEEYPEFGFLYAQEVPDTNVGSTWFADSRLAIKDLSSEFLACLRDLKIIHYRQPNKRYTQEAWEKHYKCPSANTLDTAFQRSTRPLIMKDHNGHEYIMLSPSKAVKFEGWTEEESRGIIEFLAKHITRPEYTKIHQWKKGQLLIWVNNVMNHYGVYDYHGSSRKLWRAYLK